MPHREEVNARAGALLRAPNTNEFRYGVELLRSALAGSIVVIRQEIYDCAAGLLAATADPDMQAGIAALAQMLGADVDVAAHRRRVTVLEAERYTLDIPQRVVLINAAGRELTP